MGLFSTTHHHHHSRTEVVPYVQTVIEKKAPTDESLRLLHEFEEKAKAKLLATVILNNNVVEAKILAFITGAMEDVVEYVIMFHLNGKKYQHKERVPREQWEAEFGEIPKESTQYPILAHIYQQIGKAIGKLLMEQTPGFISQYKK